MADMNRRDLLTLGLASTSAYALGRFPALAQATYPDHPIKLIVPFSAGGVVDAVGRFWAEKIRTQLTTIVVENQGGAGGVIGAQEVVRATPDGYTLLLGNTSTQVLNPMVMAKPPYDALKDFMPITIIAITATCIVVNAAVPVKTLKELIAYAKANPNKLSYGSAGAGTLTNLTGEMFKHLTGINDIVHVPYKGAGPGITDLVSGHIPMMTPNVTGQLLELHNAGKIRILAVTSPTRLKGAPEIPTAIEAGIPDMIAQLFNGLFAPVGTPKPIIDKINKDLQTVIDMPEMREREVQLGYRFIGGSPEKLGSHLKSEIAKWDALDKKGAFK